MKPTELKKILFSLKYLKIEDFSRVGRIEIIMLTYDSYDACVMCRHSRHNAWLRNTTQNHVMNVNGFFCRKAPYLILNFLAFLFTRTRKINIIFRFDVISSVIIFITYSGQCPALRQLNQREWLRLDEALLSQLKSEYLLTAPAIDYKVVKKYIQIFFPVFS